MIVYQPEEGLQSKLNKIAMWSPSFELTKFDFRTFVHGLVKEQYRVSDVSMWVRGKSNSSY